jgi:hypothetical protein
VAHLVHNHVGLPKHLAQRHPVAIGDGLSLRVGRAMVGLGWEWRDGEDNAISSGKMWVGRGRDSGQRMVSGRG